MVGVQWPVEEAAIRCLAARRQSLSATQRSTFAVAIRLRATRNVAVGRGGFGGSFRIVSGGEGEPAAVALGGGALP